MNDFKLRILDDELFIFIQFLLKKISEYFYWMVVRFPHQKMIAFSTEEDAKKWIQKCLFALNSEIRLPLTNL